MHEVSKGPPSAFASSAKESATLRRLIAAVAFGVILSGCLGGGGSSLPQTATGSPNASGPQSVTVAIKIPAKTATPAMPAMPATSATTRRNPLYISANTQSASIAVNGGTPVVADLAAGSANCTPASGAGRTCTVTLNAPVGNDTFTEITYASTNATGAALSQTTTSATIVAGKANVVNFALDGIVASIAVTASTTAPAIGTASTIPVVVTFDDASGAAIIGNDPFVNAITLTTSDTSGATKFSKSTLASPADAVGLTLAYTGAQIPQFLLSATATGVAAAKITPAVLTPAYAPSDVFNDWPTYSYDNQRDGYNPNSTAFTPASIANIHVGWFTPVGGSTKAAQPILMTNVAGHTGLLFIANFGWAQAYDALTGALVWSQQNIPDQSVQDCGIAGISGTAAYDKALSAIFIADGNGGTNPNQTYVYRLDAATGNVTGSVNVTPTLLPGEANYSHAGITLANGRVYVGLGSDCEGTTTGLYPSWRGQVDSVDPSSMTLNGTFFTTYGQGGNNYGGGGIWGWGGVSTDFSGNVFVGTGNAETASAVAQPITPPFVAAPAENSGYGEQLVKLSSDLSAVEGADAPTFNFAVGIADLDFPGTPTVFQTPLTSGCGVLAATQGKGGKLVVNNTATMGEVASYELSVPNGNAYYIGNPAYSPNTGYLYAAITSSGAGSSMLPPGLAAIGNCGTSMVWNSQFGPDSALYTGENPRSSPAVSSGGVVFIGTPCTPNGSGGCGAPGALGGALWAIDATTGTVLNGGNPLVVTPDDIRMAPIIDGEWLYVLDNSGNFYALTIDPTVPTAKVRGARKVTSRLNFRRE